MKFFFLRVIYVDDIDRRRGVILGLVYCVQMGEIIFDDIIKY